jgi:recombination associated protein RdgC
VWFKQLQLFQLTGSYPRSIEELLENVELLIFQPCLPSMNVSIGWVSPLDEEDGPLLRSINGCIMFCLQIQEKILPSIVVRQELENKVKQMEASQDRKVRQKEKLSLKDEITMTLLPRAFSKFTKVYGYIDTKNNWLVIGSSSSNKIEQFISLFRKSVTEEVKSIEVEKLSPILTSWLKSQQYPSTLAVEKTCLLQDVEQQNRTIRCRHQNLFAPSIQELIKDGCEVKQLALSWQDRIEFILHEDFSLQSIKFQDEIKEQAKEMEPETKQQYFDADFLIMGDTLSALLFDLLDVFQKSKDEKIAPIEKTQAAELSVETV